MESNIYLRGGAVKGSVAEWEDSWVDGWRKAGSRGAGRACRSGMTGAMAGSVTKGTVPVVTFSRVFVTKGTVPVVTHGQAARSRRLYHQMANAGVMRVMARPRRMAPTGVAWPERISEALA